MMSKQLRIPLLMFIFAGTTIVLGKVILDPNIGKRQLTPVTFPQNVPLKGWQLQKSEPFISKTDKYGQTVGKPFAKAKPPPKSSIIPKGNFFTSSQTSIA